MHNSQPLGVTTERNIADSPTPYTQNDARKKLQEVIKNKYQLKVKINEIKHHHLSIFFDHENGGTYYIKRNYRGSDNAITDYISLNMRDFSFLI